MLGFGCRVIAYDIKESFILKEKGVEYRPLPEVLSNADIVSLHCPLTQGTHHLINSSMLSIMKKGAMLINTSRGAVINTAHVIEALKSERLGYLGIDVYEQEEHLFFKDLSESIILDDSILRLISFPNVLITSHQGFFTREALEQIAVTTINSFSDFEKGLPLKNEVLLSNNNLHANA
jgi:D-lactate dehydrogenase